VLLRAETTEDAEIAEAKTSTTWVVIQTRSVETFEMASTSNDRNRFRSNYEDERVECAYRLDILVNKQVIVEVKSVVRLTEVHRAPMLSYLRLTGCQPGLALNFNVNVLSRGGILRVVNGLNED